MKKQPVAPGVRVFVNRVEPPRVERARTADDAMYFVAFGQQQFRQIGSILSGNPRDQRAFCHKNRGPDSRSEPDNASLEVTSVTGETCHRLLSTVSWPVAVQLRQFRH